MEVHAGLSEGFCRRIFARTAQLSERPRRAGDRSASLHELALRQVVESCDSAAVQSSMDELFEIASVIAQWPPATWAWVLPRINHQLLLACKSVGLVPPVENLPETEALRRAVSDAAVTAAIHRDEQRYRDARTRELAGKELTGADDAALAGCEPISVFGEWGTWLGAADKPALPPQQLLFAFERAQLSPALGDKVFEDRLEDFEENFDIFTGGLLRGLSWDGVLAAGGAVLACALRTRVPLSGLADDEDAQLVRDQARYSYFEASEYHLFRRAGNPWGGTPGSYKDEIAGMNQKSPFSSSSDVDLFLIGLDPKAALEKVKSIHRTCFRNFRGKVLCISTGSAITFACGYPKRHIQVVLKVFERPMDVFASFDVDCCAFGYDGTGCVCTPRALQAAVQRVNLINLSRRSCTYETRLIKYAMRGFAVGVAETLLERTRIDAAFFDKASLEAGGTSKFKGLARLIAADRVADFRRRSTGAGKLAAGTGPVSISESQGYEHAKGKHSSLPDAARHCQPQGVDYTSQAANLSAVEAFSRDESHELSHQSLHGLPAAANHVSSVDPVPGRRTHGMDQVVPSKVTTLENRALYATGAVPWRLGFDAVRIAEQLTLARNKGNQLQQFRRDIEAENAELSPHYSLTMARTASALPSENVIAWGETLEAAKLTRASFTEANQCSSFFPLPPAGFTSGCHVTDDAALAFSSLVYKPASTHRLGVRQPRKEGSAYPCVSQLEWAQGLAEGARVECMATARPRSSREMTTGSLFRDDGSLWRRATVLNASKAEKQVMINTPKGKRPKTQTCLDLKLRLDGAEEGEEPVACKETAVREMLPLDIVITTMAQSGVLPENVHRSILLHSPLWYGDPRAKLLGISESEWLPKRGLQLRGAMSPDETAAARAVIEQLEADADLIAMGGHCLEVVEVRTL